MTNSESSQKNPFVLVVDDDTTTLFLARQYLSNAGFSVEIAENGKIALTEIDNKKPDIVLLDVQMPEMNGFETCAKIRERVSNNTALARPTVLPNSGRHGPSLLAERGQ